MNEKCSLSNLSRYLRVIGFLSLIIILIIVVYYYLRSNHSTILEKYEGYSRRDCVVYLKGDIADTEKCDATQGTSNYTDTCSYRFDGWSEFATYTDKDGKTIPYPKKIYTLTNTNSGSFTNPMFTNNCFKPNTSEEDGIPQEFEYNANNVVRYDEQGTSGNTAVGTNIFGGSRYSSMQFLNTANPTDNYNTLLDSICSASTRALGSLKDSVFYMFEFDGTTNKLTNITSVALNDDQTTFSISSKYNVLTNLPPIITPLKDAYGIQYDTNAKSLKIFKKNNIERETFVFKFNYMSYVCPQSQIKNYMRAKRMIIPDKFIKYGAATTPNYSVNISINNNINKDWDWSNYSSKDFNVDFSDMLKTDLTTSIDYRKKEIKLSYKEREDIALANYNDAQDALTAASTARTNFTTDFPTFSNLIGIQKQDNTRVFNYTSGYNTSIIDNLNISIPQGANATKVGSDICIRFLYNTNNNSNGRTQYTFDVVGKGIVCDILMIGGGGGGGSVDGGGGGAGACIVALKQNLNAGSYTIAVGSGGIGGSLNRTATIIQQTTDGANTSISNSSGAEIYRAVGGGRSGNLEKIENFGITMTQYIGKTGGCGGGAGFWQGNSGVSGGAVSTLNIVNGASGISPSVTTTYGVYGNVGGSMQQWTNGNYSTANAGGGGGIGFAGASGIASSNRSGVGGDGLAQVSINSTLINFKTHFAPDWGSFGVLSGGLYYIGGGGGGGGYSNSSSRVAGGLGGGGIGDNASNNLTFADAPGDGLANTGSGGGGAAGNAGANGGTGGSGLVIIRIKINNNNIVSPFKILDNNINTFYSREQPNISNIIIDASSIQSKILTSFVFLQKGYYYFKADISGGSYDPNMMIYSDLLIFDETTLNSSRIYNARIVYKNNNSSPTYLNKPIYIPNGKFYKLAYRYTTCNTTTNKIYANFVLDCKYSSLTSDTFVTLDTTNNDANNTYSSINNISFNLQLKDYLYCGGNLNNHYNNSGIMTRFSNVKYTDNIDANYSSIIEYLDLDSINFFNIKALRLDRDIKLKYKDIDLPAIITANYGTDSIIINIINIITIINKLKSNNNAVNYSSYLPTAIRSIYKDATIDEIFGKNYERLVTKERVSNYSEISNTTTIRPKKIYVEAVA